MKFRVSLSLDGILEVNVIEYDNIDCGRSHYMFSTNPDDVDEFVGRFIQPHIQVFPNGKEKVITE